MRKSILIVFAVVTSYIANAQVNDLPVIGNKFTFGLDAGLALPGSDYGATSASPDNNSGNGIDGYAKSGTCLDAYAGIRFGKVIGIMAQYGINKNSYNASALNNEAGTASASGGYTIGEYLAGPYLTMTLVKVKIEAKLLAGLVSANYPNTTFTYNGFLNTYGQSVVSAYQSGNGFGYCAGIKVKYILMEGLLNIGIGVNYVGSDISYKGVSTLESGNVPIQSTVISNKMAISIIQPTIGVSLDI